MYFPSIDIKQALQEAQQHHRAGRLQQAEEIYKQILARDADNAEAMHSLGLIALQNGRCNTAARLLQKAIAINPDQAFYHINLGNALNAQGKIHEAISAFNKAVELKPDMAAAHNNLGVIYKNLDKLEDAAAAFQKAVDLKPDYADALNNLGVVQKEQGNLDTAAASFKKALRVMPNSADAHYNLGNVLQQQKQYDAAIDAYKLSLRLKPKSADGYFNLAIAYHACDKYDYAINAYKKALQILPDHVEALNKLGNAELRLGNFDSATAAFQKTLDLNPEDAEAYFGLGNIRREKGDIALAEELFNKALKIKPKYSAAHCQLSFTRRHREYDADIQAMEVLLDAEGISDRDRLNLNFGLGKAFEDLGMYEKAFSFIREGNSLKRKSYDYTIDEDRQLFAKIKKVFSRELFTEFASAGLHDSTPVFILGMPRSGTTLLEQILASHPDVHGAGELLYIQSMIQHFCCGDENRSYPDCIQKFSESDYTKMGNAYAERLRLQYSSKVTHIINKMPHNFVHVGFIKLLLPKARIIHSKRNPMDTCLSIYKNLFAGTHNYAYNLEELGQYYRLYEDLMAHWRSVLPDFIFEVEYEEMVSDQEKQTRRLLEFCGLEWDEACLLFHKSTRAVRTASSVQVRQPIYESSVQLWKRYEKELQPLVAALNYSA